MNKISENRELLSAEITKDKYKSLAKVSNFWIDDIFKTIVLGNIWQNHKIMKNPKNGATISNKSQIWEP